MSESVPQSAAESGDRVGGECDAPSASAEADASAVAPLSFSQQRLWFLEQMHPEAAAYNVPELILLRGPLDTATLAAALEQLVTHHEALRTRFVMLDGKPMQVIEDRCPFALQRLELPETSGAGRGRAAADLIDELLVRPFDLRRAPLLRAYLLRLQEHEHILLLLAHHIVVDGQSVEILREELMQLYAALHAGRSLALPEPRIEYADYALWHRAWFAGEVRAKQLEYWMKYLDGASSILQLPTDRPRPWQPRFEGDVHFFDVPAAVSEGFGRLCAASGCTPFMVLLTVYAVLLQRYSRQEDLCIGYPIANRHHRNLDRVVGFFVNTLVFRARFDGNPTFLQLLGRTREAVLQAFEYQDLPFEQLVAELGIERDRARAPLVQSVFSFQQSAHFGVEFGEVFWHSQPVPVHRAKFELALAMWEHEGVLQGSLEFSTALFEKASIERMAAHFTVLLQSFVAAPDQPVLNPPMLSPAELAEWRRGAAIARPAACPRLYCLHEQFEAQARRLPDACAVECDGRAITYAELNARANALARELRASGVVPDVLVPICAERSIELVIGILAILKAGGAYVPIDPQQPHERMAFVLQDVGASVVVSVQSLVERLPGSDLKRICIDRQPVCAANAENLSCRISPENLAYCIYTSGSTGQPKGVLVTHANVSRLFTATEHWFGFSEQDVWTMFHSPAFDFSVWEVFGALLHAGKLVIVPQLVSRMPERFIELLRSASVTVLNQTPSAFQQLLIACEADPRGCAFDHRCAAGPTEAAVLPVDARSGGEFDQTRIRDCGFADDAGAVSEDVGHEPAEAGAAGV